MRWVIRRNGMFYRPNYSGYTKDIVYAGLYDERSAKSRVDPGAGVTAHPASEFKADIDASLAETQAYLARLQNLRGELP